MKSVEWTPMRGRANETARMVLGIILLVLVIGVWVYLWVPASPVF